jgi:hypothetical protein
MSEVRISDVLQYTSIILDMAVIKALYSLVSWTGGPRFILMTRNYLLLVAAIIGGLDNTL